MAEHPKGYCPVFGNYPAEYNRAVHGPYYPWVNYGKRDTPLNQVKIGEFKDWMMRRNKTPQAALAACSRMFHLYVFKWKEPRFASVSKSLTQMCIFVSVASLFLSYGHYRKERRHKYHW